MFTIFSSALSALNADSTAIDVVANNLANLNTPGFKASDLVFRDLVTESLGAGLGETQVGFGVAQPLTIREFQQGAVQTTNGVLDAAIQGDGFFIIKQPTSGAILYSRDGNFTTDKNGNLLTDTGDNVQGWTAIDPATGVVDANGPIGNIIVPIGSLKPPVATTSLTVQLNLNSAAASDATSDFSTPVTVYDSLGTPHVVTLNFAKTASNTWTYQADVPGEDVAAGTPGTPYDIPGASGTLTFNSDGQLTTPPDGTPIVIALAGLNDGASDMTVTWNPYDSNGAGTITQFSEASAVSAATQDGSPAAELNSVGINDQGQVLAEYSDGSETVVGQIALANIRNPNTLIATGSNAFQLSELTAAPAVGTPGTGGRGTIQGGAIESSTVDIATEFTNMLIYQRAYEANAHVITTADTLTQDTINLVH